MDEVILTGDMSLPFASDNWAELTHFSAGEGSRTNQYEATSRSIQPAVLDSLRDQLNGLEVDPSRAKVTYVWLLTQ